MRKLREPEIVIKEAIQKITGPERAALMGALIVGLLTHMYVFMNKLYNYDELVATPGGYGVAAQNNRWFLEWMGRAVSHFMGGSYSIPYWNGILTMILLLVSAVLVVRMVDCQNSIFAFCIGGIMTAFPAVVSMFFFMFTAVYYAIGLLLSMISAYLVIRHPKNVLLHILSVLLLACSLGTYQAYFPNTVCLLLISMILLCAFAEQISVKDIILTGLRYLSVLAISLLCYFAANKFFLKLWNLSSGMGDYQGLDTMGSITLKEMISGIRSCYKNFFALAFREELFLNTRGLMQKGYFAVMLLLFGSIVVYILYKRKQAVKNGILLVCVLLFPIAMFLIYIMAPKAFVYPLMTYPVVFLFVFFLIWIEKFVDQIKGQAVFAVLLQWAAVGISAMMLFFYIWYGNGNYMAMEYTKYHDFAYLQTMVTQIKSMDGYSDTLPVAIIGNEITDETTGMSDLFDKAFFMFGKSESNINNPSNIHLITKYLGYAPEFCSYERTQELMEKDEVKEMPTYPGNGSIQIVEDTIVIKLSDYK